MGKPGAFLTTDRQAHVLRPTDERTRDFDPLYREPGEDVRREQASRCMMCGVAFCQSGISFGRARTSGCPLHNLIPEWNELIYRGRMETAAERLALTSPLPEFTSRVCPALCEAACNLGTVDGQPVTIHDNERAISDWEWEHGGPARFPAPGRNAPRVTVVGSGPAGLAAAWDLARRGARVTIVERDDRAGGLLMYGIPNMKLEKSIVQRRVDLMESLGIEFRLGVDASRADVAEGLLEESDAVILACGARTPRPLASPGADAAGVVYAVDYLEAATRAVLAGDTDSSVISARGLDVVVIGGGDTGNDCVGTAVRQGAQSVRQLEFLPEPPACPREGNGWPQWPNVKKTDYGQQEAIELMGAEMRTWAADTIEVLTDERGGVRGLLVANLNWSDGTPRRIEGSEHEIPAQLVLIACGFTGPETSTFDAFGALVSDQGRALTVMEGASHRCAPKTQGAPGAAVFACGDARTGSSLVVNAIADALACADEVARELAL